MMCNNYMSCVRYQSSQKEELILKEIDPFKSMVVFHGLDLLQEQLLEDFP